MPSPGERAILFGADDGFALSQGGVSPGEKVVLYSGTLGRSQAPVSPGVDVVLTEGVAQGTASAANLLSHWRLDETSGGTVFDERDTNDGSIVGTVNQGVSGKIGTAYEFTGTGNYLDMTGYKYDITDGFSFTGWGMIYQYQDPNGNDVMNFTETIDDPEPFFMETNDVNGTDGYFTFGTDDASKADSHLITSNFQLSLNTWYFFAGVLDVPNARKELYINAESQGQLDVTWEPATGTPGFLVGVDSNRSEQWWNGKIDDVRIYDQALSDEQVLSIYQAGL